MLEDKPPHRLQRFGIGPEEEANGFYIFVT
jgi:hypothetical protein